MLKTIRDIDIKGKRAFLRVDFNVPLGENNRVDENENWRIKKTLPTIEYLLKEKARLIIISHLSGKKSLKPIADYLAELIGQEVIFINEIIGPKVKERANRMKVGEILMLENLRFYPEEEANGENFAKELAGLADIFVNDAFSVSHRQHASIVGLPKFLPSFAGFLIEEETKVLGGLIQKPIRPLATIIGGEKISTKIKLVKKMLDWSDHLLLGGALANTVLKAKGVAVGQSLIEEEMINETEKLELTNPKLHIPVDVLVSKKSSGEKDIRISPAAEVQNDEIILDIGPETIEAFSKIISQAKTIIWNGPMGLAEVKSFSSGTRKIAQAVVLSQAYSVVGGGDTISILRKMELGEKFDYLSTGGGAMFEFLAEGTLPGILALQ
ncbi:MAG: Phosphoglycerate kinase [Parcubacteria group bacterium GW2011_GWB1_41_6]|nr:MAG: Phosphoglycerate kinase [Parcubacteria group bacterium GW2011_GWB1_41_6]KKS34666.1 MAG: Phosphoglycerate kinase [Parcubacteria group bacterium GW2011_GWC2_42_13]KKS58005.1 MAG: Phosphoglycerate kinase [Parcubacteria group bacterium GW2011_GWA2_42_35]KKS70395.1 MAG: Phosphoglycerate kinase [Parcubacteria group bacterium GW2011_GWF2_42_7]